jgi:hypothetical protein
MMDISKRSRRGMEVLFGTAAKMREIIDNQAERSLDEQHCIRNGAIRLSFLFLLFFLRGSFRCIMFDFHPIPKGKVI